MTSNQKLSILFWLRKGKATKKDGKAPLYARVTIDSKDEDISLGRKVHPDFWDVDKKKDTQPCAEAKKTNTKIEQAKVDLDRHFFLLQSQYEIVTPIMLKNAYTGKPTLADKKQTLSFCPTDQTILQAFDTFIATFQKMVDEELRADGTLTHWKTTRSKVKSFLQFHGQEDIELIDIKYSFATSFYNYLTLEAERPLADATAKTHVKKTRQILGGCTKDELIPKNPLIGFICGGDVKDVPPLELYEVEKIYLKNIEIKRLAEVRDAFIFQCFTGFAFQDLYALTPENIIRVGKKGDRWLIKDRGKTGVPEMVPILPIAEEIIKKYNNDSYCLQQNKLLPVNSNTKYNAYLKELADICSIKRVLKTHLARHTFADIMLNNGAPLEDVQRMLGHKSIRTTQRYAQVRKQRLTENVKKVELVLFTKTGKLKKVA